MKNLLILLFMLFHMFSISQNNIVTELWVTNYTVPIITINNPHELLFYQNKESYDLIIEFTPISSEEANYLLYYFKTGTSCIVKLRVQERITQTTGVVDFIKQTGTVYEVNIKGVTMLNPY